VVWQLSGAIWDVLKSDEDLAGTHFRDSGPHVPHTYTVSLMTYTESPTIQIIVFKPHSNHFSYLEVPD
jgi:hypothetical protein